MRIGDLVKWKYSKDKLFIVVSIEKYDSNLSQMASLLCIQWGEYFDLFIEDLEVIDENRLTSITL